MEGGAFATWPGRFSPFCLNRVRLLRTMLVFAENRVPGRVRVLRADVYYSSYITVYYGWGMGKVTVI